MAIGDVTQLKLIQKALDATATNSQYANPSVNYKTTVTSITLHNQNTTTKREVEVYLYGTATTNNVINIPLEANSSQVLTGLDFVLSSTEVIALKQDTGTDVTCAVMGLQEQIA